MGTIVASSEECGSKQPWAINGRIDVQGGAQPLLSSSVKWRGDFVHDVFKNAAENL
jgi:hypothetical protein